MLSRDSLKLWFKIVFDVASVKVVPSIVYSKVHSHP